MTHEVELKCPYCQQRSTEWVDDDFDDMRQKCDECGKVFLYRVEVSVDVYSRKAPCLNGEPHSLTERHAKVVDGKVMGYNRCRVCDQRFELSDERKQEILKESK